MFQTINLIKDFNVVNGFLNLTITSSFYILFLDKVKNDLKYVNPDKNSPLYLVEYSSPNTNKPLHLGHVRNILLGYSMSKILQASGKRVNKTQIINDRGIHICKSIVAWLKFGENKSPDDLNEKGDFFVGKYYVLFDNKEYNIQVNTLLEDGQTEEYAKANAPIFMEAQDLLIKWEANDKEVRELWNKMNDWVYNGFEDTYKMLGVDFDSYYYESDTYLLGKKVVDIGLEKGVFYKKEDSSVWIDLSAEGLDEKIILRSDGTSVYMTQDLGTAYQRFLDHSKIDGMVYTVGNEQDYHFKVLFLILKKLVVKLGRKFISFKLWYG